MIKAKWREGYGLFHADAQKVASVGRFNQSFLVRGIRWV